MMRRSLFALAVVSVLSLPFSALAEAPQSVTGLNAEAQEDGTIQVRWTPVGGEVSAYRVYFSQKSILENDGYYDDVETTEGPVSEYVLRSVPSSLTTIFVSVMAVNAQGEESQYFIEEVQVQRSMGQPMNEPPASLPATDSSLRPGTVGQHAPPAVGTGALCHARGSGVFGHADHRALSGPLCVLHR